MYTINKVEIMNLTEGEVKELYSINNYIVEKYSFLHRFRSIDEYRTLFLESFKGPDNELFILNKDTTSCGVLNCIKSADWSGKEQYKLTIWLSSLDINEDMKECLSQFINKKLAQYDELAVVTYNDELEDLIVKYNHRVNLKSNYYTLKKENIDIEKLSKAIKEYGEHNSDLKIKYADVISEEHIEQYCDLFMETMLDMTDEKEEGYVRYVITPEKQRKINEMNIKLNKAHHCYMIFNSEDEMIAKSNVSVDNNDSRFPYQFMIGVKRAYRGRSLGKWMYASMYKRLHENVEFEKVHVIHHPENQHAISISKWVGYEFGYLEITHVLNNK